MNLGQKIRRWVAGRLGGTPAVAKYDAAPADKKDDVLVGSAKDLAQQKLLDNYKPAAIALVDEFAAEFATKEEGFASQTKDTIERSLIRLLESSPLVPAAASLPLQIAITVLFDRIDVTPYLKQGRAGVYLLADKVKVAINGARL